MYFAFEKKKENRNEAKNLTTGQQPTGAKLAAF